MMETMTNSSYILLTILLIEKLLKRLKLVDSNTISQQARSTATTA